METADTRNFMERMLGGVLLWDGAMGSALIAKGLEPGAPPEEWNVSRPDTIRKIHEAYILAGSDVVTTNSFGATPSRLGGYGFKDRVADINNAAVTVARDAITGSAAGRRVFVAFSVGPTGKMLAPVGNASESEIEDDFSGQLEALKEPVDVFLGETFFDIREALLFLKALREVRQKGVPIGLTFTFNRTPRGFFTIMGDNVSGTISRARESGAEFSGANCSLTSGDMKDLAEILVAEHDCPLLCQPNAGQPTLENGAPVYKQDPEEFATDAARMIEMGIHAVGGCCGSSPEFIRQAAGLIKTDD
jgi:5-methyltetrahydrofolate--homocysteine methyltransferase